MCAPLYYRRLLSMCDDRQFEVVTECESHQSAKQAALDLLYDRAVQAGLKPHWKARKGKGPAVTFILPKNKMKEHTGEWKAKILFHYCCHTLRYYGCIIGRCLPFLLKTCKTLVPELEMLNTTCILRFVRRWND